MRETILTLRETVVKIGPNQPAVLIGERINPTGKKSFANALLSGDFSVIEKEALNQIKMGAQVLDVNVGAAGIDEPATLRQAVKILMKIVDVPLCIDSNDPIALEAALDIYEGKALINSVTGEKAMLLKILPIVKKYGAAVIGLCMDDQGIPVNCEERIKIASKILEACDGYGIPKEDVIFDGLTMTVGTDFQAAVTTLKTVYSLTHELGVNTTLGASNVSFGLPDRRVINQTFVAMAIQNGLTALIIDPTVPDIRRSIRAADLLKGNDEWAKNYLQDYRAYS